MDQSCHHQSPLLPFLVTGHCVSKTTFSLLAAFNRGNCLKMCRGTFGTLIPSYQRFFI